MRTCLTYHAGCKVELTIQTAVLTADVFQLEQKNIFTADVFQYFYEFILYRSYSQLTATIQTVVLTADVFQLKYIFGVYIF